LSGGAGKGYGIGCNITVAGKIEAYISGAGWMSSISTFKPGMIFTYCYTQTGKTWACYWNGRYDNGGTSLTSLTSDTGAKYLMRRQDAPVSYTYGTLYDFKCFDFVLSSIQVMDYHQRMMKSINSI
jgi:hypothetical protein